MTFSYLILDFANTIFSTRANCARNPPKVGDTITATVAPVGATNVVYSWLADGTAIEGATASTFTVTDAQLGKKISVTVTGDEESKATSAETEAVRAKEGTALELISAEQVGSREISVSFSDAVTTDDKITVDKGTTKGLKYSIEYSSNFTSAVLTLDDKITAVDYTVTLTPADTAMTASSKSFTGKSASLQKIDFLNNYLVMKDNTYKVGYCYVKGYNDYEEEVNLSGLTVTAGLGTMTSYDSETGKITLTTNTDNGYMLMKEIPVNVSYQVGNNILTATANLEVTSRAYVNELTLGDIKKDGTPRADGRLTVTELKTGKYYVEVKDIKDQYGNALGADDLNTQVDPDKVLFIIPSNTGAYYTTAGFDTVNGGTVLWLDAPADPKPGTMALTITGASGKTFTKDITIEDDPYIQTLTVSYPELYVNVDKSAPFDFSAVDQYGNEVDLWEVKPSLNGGVLQFDDMNNMTGRKTEISVSSTTTSFNPVTYDTSKRTFSVTVETNGETKGNQVVFASTTAGMIINTQTVTVGGVGNPESVKSSLKDGANTTLDVMNSSFNFLNYVQFVDTNGNTMNPDTDKTYPAFRAGGYDAAATSVVAKPATVDNYDEYGWILTTEDNKPQNGKAIEGLTSTTVATAATYCVALVGKYSNSGTKYDVLSVQSFRIRETDTTAANIRSYSARVKKGQDLLYIADGSEDFATIEVVAKNKTGEEFVIDTTYDYSLTPPAGMSIVTGSDGLLALSGDTDTVNGSGKAKVTVFVGGKEEATVEVSYDDADGVATSVGMSNKRTKAAVESTTINTKSASGVNVKAENGVLTITNANEYGDTYEAKVVDQYGLTMKDSKFFVNGAAMEAKTVASDGANPVVIQIKNANGIEETYRLYVPTGQNCVIAEPTYPVTSAGYEMEVTTASNIAYADKASTSKVVLTVKETESGDPYTLIASSKTTITGPNFSQSTAGITGVASSTASAFAITMNAPDGKITIGPDNTHAVLCEPGTYTVSYTDAVVGTVSNTFTVGKGDAGKITSAQLNLGTVVENADKTGVTITINTAASLGVGKLTLSNSDGEAIAEGEVIAAGTVPTLTYLEGKNLGEAASAGKFTQGAYKLTWVGDSSLWTSGSVEAETLATFEPTYNQIATSTNGEVNTTSLTVTETETKFTITGLLALDQYGETVANGVTGTKIPVTSAVAGGEDTQSATVTGPNATTAADGTNYEITNGTGAITIELIGTGLGAETIGTAEIVVLGTTVTVTFAATSTAAVSAVAD